MCAAVNVSVTHFHTSELSFSLTSFFSHLFFFIIFELFFFFLLPRVILLNLAAIVVEREEVCDLKTASLNPQTKVRMGSG